MVNNRIQNTDNKNNINNSPYIDTILNKSNKYLNSLLTTKEIEDIYKKTGYLKYEKNIDTVVEKWIEIYCHTIKNKYQSTYKHDKQLTKFIQTKSNNPHIIWGNCYNVMKALPPESVHLLVTSPPYYNAREYSHWENIDKYLDDMRLIIHEAYRILDNHRVFIWNVGDIFDNDNITTKSVWGKRRIPLSAYFIKIFEEEGFTFVDDFIWDKGEVQSERHKNAGNPYPFYQYPMNCYEHIIVFHKHRDDPIRYPCPICGCLNVNGNAYTEIGLRSWECKNNECFKRSKSNRGKRYSLKTIITQKHHTNDCKITENDIHKWRRDIIKITPVIKINSKGINKLGHTAPFPMDIPDFAIKNFTYPNDIVLDPFGGSFTTIIAAHKLGRKGIGIEINKNMFRDSSLKNLKHNIPETDIMEFDYE